MTTSTKLTLDKWRELFTTAQAHRATMDYKFNMRRDQYKGTSHLYKQDGTKYKKRADVVRKVAFEFVNTQVDNELPYPKVIARDARFVDAAKTVEEYLKSEMERLEIEQINDVAEREVGIQGNYWYLIEWDNSQSTPLTFGELTIRGYTVDDVWVQPGVTNVDDAEYVFTADTISINKLKKLYKVKEDIPENAGIKGMCKMITGYYFSDRGFLSKIAWVDDVLVFHDEDYEVRKVRKCQACNTLVPQADECPVCKGTNIKTETLEEEILTEDLVNLDTGEVDLKKGTAIKWYNPRTLPIVNRINVSNSDSIYGVSDVDIVAEHQNSLSRILSKMYENVMKGGSIVTTPADTQIPNNDDTLKRVVLEDPRLKEAFGVFNVQASIQQEDILAGRIYGVSRDEIGITDSYQGKRDPTAESGKAKEISAAQAAGRLESKRRMKAAAFGRIYERMFKLLLANCDEPRTYTRIKNDGLVEEGQFHRYLFLEVNPKTGETYYNDRFIFGTDNASVLGTQRELMWQETRNNFVSGSFGNPQDPMVIRMYWDLMRQLGYPKAESVLANINNLLMRGGTVANDQNSKQ